MQPSRSLYQKSGDANSSTRSGAHLIEHDLANERNACRLVGVSRSGYQYKPVKRQDDELRVRLRELSTEYSRYGYLMLHGLLVVEGCPDKATATSLHQAGILSEPMQYIFDASSPELVIAGSTEP